MPIVVILQCLQTFQPFTLPVFSFGTFTKKLPDSDFGNFTILLVDEGSCVNAVVYGGKLTKEMVKVAECLAGKIGKRVFLQVWMKDWKVLEGEGFREIGRVGWMEKVFT